MTHKPVKLHIYFFFSFPAVVFITSSSFIFCCLHASSLRWVAGVLCVLFKGMICFGSFSVSVSFVLNSTLYSVLLLSLNLWKWLQSQTNMCHHAVCLADTYFDGFHCNYCDDQLIFVDSLNRTGQFKPYLDVTVLVRLDSNHHKSLYTHSAVSVHGETYLARL